MTRPLLLNLEPLAYSPDAFTILNSFADVENGPLERESLLQKIGLYDGIVVRLAHKINGEVLSQGRRLRVVSTATTGLNHIDLADAEKRGIAVLSLRGEQEFLKTIHATAEHTFGLILSLLRHIPAAQAHIVSGGWNRDPFRGEELAGKTIGILGFGRLGSKVGHYAEAFGMSVIAHDTASVSYPSYVRGVSFERLLAESDILSVHVPYDPSTHHLLDRKALASLKKGSVLINTSRGEIIDEAALLELLQKDHIRAAALDVLSGENAGEPDWALNDPLIKYAQNNQNLILTPHIGGATIQSMHKTEIFMAKKMKQFFLGLETGRRGA